MAKQKVRISGNGMSRPTAYAVRDENGKWGLDVGAVSACIAEYLKEAEELGRYSVAGMCIALGITRDTLALWRSGYASAEDAAIAEVVPNEALAECVALGMLHIERYWEECDKSGVQSKYMKMLEKSGALGGADDATVYAPFDMGGLGKFCK